ncbi:hypothetical protein GGX14DRAFT_397702 [Mycena pura]|uniref:Uncharacterized protein n=1 Tax=Mycena pura TaxID=153505 RepID=A0AAD6V8F4_9AGAR|nr:hypothetical protein GGX14DRAFT_397702 [Mycena pura]
MHPAPAPTRHATRLHRSRVLSTKGVPTVHLEAGLARVGGLTFSRYGTRLFVARAMTGLARVWIRLCDAAAPAHIYALHRGRTGAVAESFSAARNGRFVALVMHVFPVNPGARMCAAISGRRVLGCELEPRLSEAQQAPLHCTANNPRACLAHVSRVFPAYQPPSTRRCRRMRSAIRRRKPRGAAWLSMPSRRPAMQHSDQRIRPTRSKDAGLAPYVWASMRAGMRGPGVQQTLGSKRRVNA